MKELTQLKNRTDRRLAQEKIRADLDLIARQVHSLLGPDLHSLLLCGSFGRGEGSVVVEGGQVSIVNDYDFTVVLNAPGPLAYARLYRRVRGPLESLAEDLARQLRVKQVDLSPKPLGYFSGWWGRKPALKIESYEVKKGHVLVWPRDAQDDPRKNPTALMPDWQARDIPLFEGTWLFRNRGLGLVLAALYLDAEGRVAPEHRENFIIECNKAILAAGDSLLLLQGHYHHLYQRRLALAPKLARVDVGFGPVLAAAYTRALEFKLRPDFTQVDTRDPAGLWQKTCDLFEQVWQYFEQHRLGRGFDSWTAYAGLARPDSRPTLRSLAAALAKIRSLSPSDLARSISRSAPGFSVSLVSLVLFSRSRSSVPARDQDHKPPMEAAGRMLGLALGPDPDQNFRRLARALIALVHPGGEAGRVLAREETREEIREETRGDVQEKVQERIQPAHVPFP